MARSWSAVLCLAGGLWAAGCTAHGSYELSWQFVGEDPEMIGIGLSCGKHGVDSIRVTGSSTGGDGETFTALCADGGLAHSIPVGTWSFVVHQLDVRGQAITVPQVDAQGQPVLGADGAPLLVPDPTATGTIAEDTNVKLDPPKVELTPRPECNDGVDNDCDGRVDLDDLQCAGPYTTAEVTAPGAGC